VPADFPIPAGDSDFRLGLFLPRDEPDWFGRSAYPTRILLLSGRALVILPHPKTREPVIRIPLQELVFVEAAHILLIGWLRFVEKGSEHKFPYNTRSARPVEEFLRVLREEYLPGTLDMSASGRACPAPTPHPGRGEACLAPRRTLPATGKRSRGRGFRRPVWIRRTGRFEIPQRRVFRTGRR